MLFRCSRCLEKDNRIADLQTQIKFLQSMLQPTYNNEVNMEANKILDGSALPVIDISLPAQKEAEKVHREAVSIITGNYYEANE